MAGGPGWRSSSGSSPLSGSSTPGSRPSPWAATSWARARPGGSRARRGRWLVPGSPATSGWPPCSFCSGTSVTRSRWPPPGTQPWSGGSQLAERIRSHAELFPQLSHALSSPAPALEDNARRFGLDRILDGLAVLIAERSDRAHAGRGVPHRRRARRPGRHTRAVPSGRDRPLPAVRAAAGHRVLPEAARRHRPLRTPPAGRHAGRPAGQHLVPVRLDPPVRRPGRLRMRRHAGTRREWPDHGAAHLLRHRGHPSGLRTGDRRLLAARG